MTVNRYNISVSIDPEIHEYAKKYAESRKISFSRLIHEALFAVVGRDGGFDPDVRAEVEGRLAAKPGRRSLTAAEIEARDEERRRQRAELRARRLEAEAAKLRYEVKDDPRDQSEE